MRRKFGQWSFVFSAKTIACLALTAGVYLVSTPAVEAQTVTKGMLAPLSQAEANRPQVALSTAQRNDIFERLEQIHEAMLAREPQAQTGPAGLPLVPGSATNVTDPETKAQISSPSSFVIGRNNKNTNANNAALGSTLAEPAVANNGRLAFAAGNFDHAEISTNGGASWTNVHLPGGPADAPILCCDHDVVIDDHRRVVFHSYLYINGALTNGVVRIDVRSSIGGAGQPSCSYILDYAGAANNILQDFPHLGMTKDFLYLTTNDIGPIPNASGQRARIARLGIDQMQDCLATPVSFFDWPNNLEGQKVWRPVEGANVKETMYWAHNANTTQMRVFSWPETAAAPTNVLKTLSASTFGNPDCSGGVGDFDWIDGVSAGSFGFNLSGAVGQDLVAWYWQVAADAAHTQGHIHAAVFNTSGLVLVAQPAVFNNAFCFGKPNVSANKLNEFGISLGLGGNAGEGGSAASSAVGIDDDFTSGVGFFGTVFTTASGTHNRSDARYGDYFTIHPIEPCEKWFVASGYALSGGTALANVNSRYIEFGRLRSFACYDAHRNQFPEGLTAPQP